MKGRRAALGVVCALVAAIGAIAPAQAATKPAPPTFSNLDTSVPGHVIGKVVSSLPYVYINLNGGYPTLMEMTGTSTAFDLESWGHGPGTSVVAQACPEASYFSGCSYDGYSATLTPTDVIPAVTWPSDSTLGPGQSTTLSVSDPDGGGRLRVYWHTAYSDTYNQEIPRNGSVDLPATSFSGDGYLEMVRCGLQDYQTCTPFNPRLKHSMRIHPELGVSASGLTFTSKSVDTSVLLKVPQTGSYQVVWKLSDYPYPYGQDLGSGVSSGQLGPNGELDAIVLDGTGFNDPNRYYYLQTLIAVSDPEFGDYQLTSTFQVHVDRTPVAVSSVKAKDPVIYPLADTYKHPTFKAYPTTTSVVVRTQSNDAYSIEVRDSAGLTVAHLDAADWNGRRADKTAVPAGTYSLVVVDEVGNESSAVGRVTVSLKRLLPRTFKARVSAAGSLVDKFVGKCSQLRKPSLRKWRGSLGFYANTKCMKTSWQASAVSTAHEIRLPVAAAYGGIWVDTFGGAARSKPASQGLVRYLNASGRWYSSQRLSRTIRLHQSSAAYSDDFEHYVRNGRYFVWGFATASKARYDVRDFTVRLNYYVLG